MDEAAALHETIGGLVQRTFDPGGYLHFVWVIPGALVVVAVAIAYRPFVAGLPTDLRRALIAGAGLWAGSALLLELVEGRILASQHGFPTFPQATVASLQETGEMLGVLVMLDGLLSHVAALGVAVVATVRCDQGPVARRPAQRERPRNSPLTSNTAPVPSKRCEEK
ncbi:MAG TPA: hypothetical protein VFQ12_01775 [Thermoleophilaceae bacterium]|nr:hypothetical protein [Thermoleophilaceae bacterium]